MMTQENRIKDMLATKSEVIRSSEKSMANLLCPNATSDPNKFSAPVPIIGLYVAAATLVCFLLIIWDLSDAIRQEKPWLPCRAFSLNSVTLTLVAIAAKLPVDLTTSMPSELDQLSKLMGTTFICASMCFLYPSLGINRASESVTNMAALSIFVITVVVNICIQISTGLIFSFIPEHVIIMSFMMNLLCLFWVSTLHINTRKEITMEQNKEIFAKGKSRERCPEGESMLERLQSCCIHAYVSNPQFVLCKDVTCRIICLVSMFCLVIVLRVTLKSFIRNEHGFFTTNSDYGWSMRMIIGAQILLILIASLSTIFRGLIMWPHRISDDSMSYFTKEICRYKSEAHHVLSFTREDHLYDLLKVIVYCAYIFPVFIFGILDDIAHSIKFHWCKLFKNDTYWCDCALFKKAATWCALLKKRLALFKQARRYRRYEEYGNRLPKTYDREDVWMLKKCVEDMERLLRVSKKSSLDPLIQLLSKYPAPLYPYHLTKNSVSSLHSVFLARIASLSAPTLGGSLTQILSEIFDVIHFVDSILNSLKFDHRKRCRLAKAMWKGNDFSILLPKISERSQSQSDLEHALQIIEELKLATGSLCIWDDVSIITNAITRPLYESVEQQHHDMEHLFVDVLRIYLTQLPEAIFKEVAESVVEEYQEKVISMLKLVCLMESLEGKVPWSFPFESNITSLTKDSTAGHQNSTPMDDRVSDVHHVHSPESEYGEIVEDEDSGDIV